MRIALIDNLLPGIVTRATNRFAPLADFLAAHGHAVTLIEGTPPGDQPGPAILTGLNRAAASYPLTEAHRMAMQVAGLRPELIIAPLRGGIAQGLLMARACAEAFRTTRVAIWCNMPSRERFLRADDLATGMAPLIADGLERQTIAFADALIVPRELDRPLPSWVTQNGTPRFSASLPAPSPSVGAIATGNDFREIVFVGPLQRSSGIAEFIEAIQRLVGRGLICDRTIVFLGVSRSDVQGIGRDWLGLRAQRWNFRFKVIDEDAPDMVQEYLADPGRLAVAISDDPDEIQQIRAWGMHHLAVLRTSQEPRSLIGQLEAALTAALAGDPPYPPAVLSAAEWIGLIDRLAALPSRPLKHPQASTGLTVCILHHNRLHELASALATIPEELDEQPVEVIVLDNASEVAGVEERIQAAITGRPNARIIRLEDPVPQALALNRGLAEARFETVLFLDDDNVYLPGGIARLARAVAQGDFDIVATSLELFDDVDMGPAPTAGRLVFMGDPHSAGLFFNAFGDTAMAVDRRAFSKIGGFHDPGFDYPCLDWVTLAKARAAGLRIGALQWPAVRYRRDLVRADMTANKLDQEGARAFVFEAYANTFDSELVGRYAQKLHLDEL